MWRNAGVLSVPALPVIFCLRSQKAWGLEGGQVGETVEVLRPLVVGKRGVERSDLQPL